MIRFFWINPLIVAIIILIGILVILSDFTYKTYLYDVSGDIEIKIHEGATSFGKLFFKAISMIGDAPGYVVITALIIVFDRWDTGFYFLMA